MLSASGWSACTRYSAGITHLLPAPPSPGTYTGPLRQPRVQCPFPDIPGRTGFKEQQQAAQSPADLPPAAAHPAAGQRHFLPDGQRRGALWPGRGGRSWKCGAEVCTVCRTVSAPLGRVPGIMCPRPAQAPPPRPALPMGAAHRVIFSLPYCIWPGDSKPDRRLQPRQLRSQRRRQQAGVSRC